jgi:lycopene cyclase domain-containing protein
MTYLILNSYFLAVLVLFYFVSGAWRKFTLHLHTFAALLIGTAIFDNAIIGFGLVAYDENKISGIKIGLAPIEDFAYSIAVVLLATSVAALMKKKNA